jgi:tRNA (5-methylaminomethyl-2-thiouridylate)-methyltransferase
MKCAIGNVTGFYFAQSSKSICTPEYHSENMRQLVAGCRRWLGTISTAAVARTGKTGADSRFFRFSTPSERYVQEMPAREDEIVISMSSGVDSSVTALMFARNYPNVRGIFMANWSPDKIIDSNSACTVDEDWVQVQETCDQLGIPCERVNFEKEYWTQVFEPMLDQYQRGLTPNPDIGCNKYVKFGKMIEYLQTKVFEDISPEKKWWLVTGHYSKILKDLETGESRLFRADYKQKDQSYYLTSMPNSVLGQILMPMGHYTKPEVRALAQEYDLVTKDKRDSQGLCFVSQVGKFKDFLNEYIPPNPGNIVTKDGKVWGRHQGLWSATIGQKSGVSLPQGDPKYKGVWLVSDKNVERNELIISRKDDRAAFYKTGVKVDKASWYWMVDDMQWDDVDSLLSTEGRINCQIRSLQTPNVVERLTFCEEGVVHFEIGEEIFGVAAGQTLALYDRDMLLGSGVIC